MLFIVALLIQYAAAGSVFAHYMVGTITQDHASTDIDDAISVGRDAFALNVISLENWSTNAVSSLFNASSGTNFKLFFSFDMTHFTDPSQFLPLLEQYVGHENYFLYDNKPFVSTFDGGSLTFGASDPNSSWMKYFKNNLSTAGIDVFFVPNFDDAANYPSGFFDSFTVVDGAISWEFVWPNGNAGKANVSDSVDSTMISEVHTAGKIYMMPLSAFQFKHIDTSQNWYRIGEINLNDAGEGHYIGNFLNESLGNSDVRSYVDGFDYAGWQQVIPPFISAYKSGATDPSQITSSSMTAGGGSGKLVGVMWYRTLLTTASCSNDSLGKPDNWENAQDAINYAVILPDLTNGDNYGRNYTINVYSNNDMIGSFAGTFGLNGGTVLGLAAGSAESQRVEVVESSNGVNATTVLISKGKKDVLSETSGICNYNYEVVAMS
ncbi:hypothetical protein UA08_02967 [Talaromyces atroroseus]|uniref:Glucan endo-1,3-alpha-glucosidase agn1 n=1 Tax=Talaromyces atroroseus TaxID=1441469 RepID=A0A225B6U3_TALAT|nr:hypothetical protein UA08_02967 [Talaromyces atroroseus]OKL62585.1 hypothetical protein UA08_02967 [Talaromyces atroroseus]